MLTLYVKTGCPYCAKVLAAVSALGIAIEEKNVADPSVSEELIALGGKRQAPYLVDHQRGVSMYESKAIVEYLCAHYGCDPQQLGDAVAHVCPLD